jgi:hypothetical protein
MGDGGGAAGLGRVGDGSLVAPASRSLQSNRYEKPQSRRNTGFIRGFAG